MISEVLISLGANLGDRLETFRLAIERMKAIGLDDIVESVVIENKAVLPPDAPKSWDIPFLNMVIRAKTNLKPQELLKKLQNIEIELGRPKQHVKWSPRGIDLDILLWKNQNINEVDITVPHKSLMVRPFLLHLIATIAPDWTIDDECNQKNAADEKTISEIAYEKVQLKSLFTKSFVTKPRLVGILNITPDSFSDGGNYFNPKTAISHGIAMINQGASVIELGPMSLRVDAKVLSQEEEWARLEPVLSGLKNEQINCQISVETLYDENALKSLGYGIHWINNTANLLSDATLRELAKNKIKVVLMHELGVPPVKTRIIDPRENALEVVNRWINNTMDRLENLGFASNQVIIDPGIGFGKNCYQNLELLKKIKRLHKQNVVLFVGHSRKSYLEAITQKPSKERDIETIAVSKFLLDAGVDYLRVHNVEDHMRFFVADKLINS